MLVGDSRALVDGGEVIDVDGEEGIISPNVWPINQSSCYPLSLCLCLDISDSIELFVRFRVLSIVFLSLGLFQQQQLVILSPPRRRCR